MRKLIVGLLIMVVVTLISGCSTSIEEQQKDAIKNIKQTLTNQPETAKKNQNT